MEIYKKLCEILPYLTYLLSMTFYKTSNWVQRCKYAYGQPFRTEYNPDNYSRHRIKCHMVEITMPNTMLNLVPSYITENTIPNEIPTQTRLSRATELRWQWTTINHIWNQHWIKPFQSIFPTKPYEISRTQSNDFQKRGMTVPEAQTNPYSKQLLYRKRKNEAPWDALTIWER